jgi:hypothetical protein
MKSVTKETFSMQFAVTVENVPNSESSEYDDISTAVVKSFEAATTTFKEALQRYLMNLNTGDNERSRGYVYKVEVSDG